MTKFLFSSILIGMLAAGSLAQNPQPTQPPTQPPTQQPNQPAQQPVQPGQPTTQPRPSQQQPPVTTTQPRTQPQVPPGTTPSGQISSPNTVIQQTPGQNVGTSGVAPAVLPDEPPPVAPNFEAPARPLPDANRVGVDIANQLPMTLEEAITLALRNNNNIDISRNDVQVAEYNFRAARGVYDPLITSENYYESATTPTASAIGGAVNGAVTQKRFFSSGGVNGFSPIGGGVYSADFNASRTSSSNTNSLLDPQYPSALTFTYTQPLFRNFRFDNNRRQIEIARKTLGLTDAQFRQQAIEVIAQVEQAYWDLVFALRNLSVQIDAVKQARTQLESNQRLVARGVLAPIDVVAATTQITTFEQNVYTAQESVTRAENNLKTLMLPDRTSDVWARAITPVSEVSLDTPKIGLEIALTEAIRNRPEIAQLETNAEINRIDERYYRNQTKPQIDLVGQYTSQGLAGSPTARGQTIGVPENLQGGIVNSLGNLFGQDYPTYRVGVAISLPWGNTVAKANLGRTLVQANRIGNQRAQTEQIIEAEVRNSMQALKSGEARLASALASRQSAEQLYESEQRQFRAGTTTFYLVLQRQTELLAARSRELQAQTDLNKAISEFQRATGTTLSANNVTVSQKQEFQYVPNRKNTAANSRFFSK
jgi:HAE1 family hydrophobic/amphiphilic exporter-1